MKITELHAAYGVPLYFGKAISTRGTRYDFVGTEAGETVRATREEIHTVLQIGRTVTPPPALSSAIRSAIHSAVNAAKPTVGATFQRATALLAVDRSLLLQASG